MRGGRAGRTDRVQRAYTCPDEECGRAVFLSRDQAKAAVRQSHPGSGLRPYRSCDGNGFHLGPLAAPVVEGTRSRDDVYGGQP